MRSAWFVSLHQWLKTSRGMLWVLGCIFCLNTFLFLYTKHNNVPSWQKREDASGFSWYYAHHFLYFYYYKGLFPLATLHDSLDFSPQAATREIQDQGRELIMEYDHWSRLGEHARILAFLPDAWLAQSPEKPSVRLFNAIWFVTALISLFVSFRRAGKPIMGLVFVILVQLTPFYLFEVFDNENIFALQASVFFIILGLHAPLVFGRKQSFISLSIITLLSGFLAGFASEVRNEVAIVILTPIIIYLLVKSIRLPARILLAGLCLLIFMGTRYGIRQYFNVLYNNSTLLVKEHQGHVYTGSRISGHNFWHPVFCGLGDFDKKYGYAWDDLVAYRYAVPVLKQKYHLTLPWKGDYHTGEYYDKDSLYYKKFDEIPEYENVIREKVLHDVRNDPAWYMTIVGRRMLRTLTQTIPIPWLAWLLIPIWLIFIKKIRRVHWIMLLSSLPLSVSPILIYSGKGATYTSVFLYILLVILLGDFLMHTNRLKDGQLT